MWVCRLSAAFRLPETRESCSPSCALIISDTSPPICCSSVSIAPVKFWALSNSMARLARFSSALVAR
jgi:hypothetical protein